MLFLNWVPEAKYKAVKQCYNIENVQKIKAA